MTHIQWDPAMSIGNEQVDAQHRRLIELLHDVREAVENRRGREVSAAALKSLCDYAVEHFADEEALMDMDTYPEYDQHIAQHMEGTDKALDFLQAFNEEKDVDMEAFLAFLSDWVQTHIFEMDQTLGRHLRARGLAADPAAGAGPGGAA